MTGTVRFRPVRRRHRAPVTIWTPSFILWCVAMPIVSAAGGVALALFLKHHWW